MIVTRRGDVATINSDMLTIKVRLEGSAPRATSEVVGEDLRAVLPFCARLDPAERFAVKRPSHNSNTKILRGVL